MIFSEDHGEAEENPEEGFACAVLLLDVESWPLCRDAQPSLSSLGQDGLVAAAH